MADLKKYINSTLPSFTNTNLCIWSSDHDPEKNSEDGQIQNPNQINTLAQSECTVKATNLWTILNDGSGMGKISVQYYYFFPLAINVL